MIRGYFRWLLFGSSYSPLLAIIAIRVWGNWGAVIVCIGLIAISLSALLLILVLTLRKDPVSLSVAGVSNRTSDLTGYIASYIIPFIPDSSLDTKELIALGVLLFMLGSVYVNSNMLYVNPMFQVLGYQLYEIDAGAGPPVVVLTSRRPRPGSVRIREVTDGFAILP